MHIGNFQSPEHFRKFQVSSHLTDEFQFRNALFIRYIYIVPSFQLPHHLFQCGILEIEYTVFPCHHFFHIHILYDPDA